MHLNIVHLYPHTMSTYGDSGNSICLAKRATWRGIDATVHQVDIGDLIPEQADLYFFGGGQDASQTRVAEDLQTKAERIRQDVSKGVPLLAICGGYQLLGRSYQPFGAEPLQGIGIFPVETKASSDRMIGNLIIEADSHLDLGSEIRTIVGFENHSGKTYILDEAAHPLGTVKKGFGNNGSDHTEGCIMGSVIGCYLHGSLLPKNPHLADWLIERACKLQEATFTLKPLDDTVEWAAHAAIVERYA